MVPHEISNCISKILPPPDHLVTSSGDILSVMKEEFAHRLRNREISPEYAELKEIKEYLCKLRLQITKQATFYRVW